MSDAVGRPAARAAHVEIPRTARYWSVGEPHAPEVWVALHGYGQLAEYFVRHLAPFAGAHRLVVAPEALNRFYLGSGEGGSNAERRVGATWMTREDRDAEIRDYVRWLDRALDDATAGFDPDRTRLCVLGFSQGAVTATRWLAARHRDGRPPAARLVLWGGELPHDLDLAAAADPLRATALALVVGDADPFVTEATVERQTARLDGAGVPYAVVRYAGGHRLEREALARVLEG